MGWKPVSSVVLVLIVIHGSTGQTPVQVGDMVCFTNFDTGVMTATMIVYKKTSLATRIFFTDDNFNEFSGTECIWSGDGTDADPFKVSVQIDTNFNNPPIGQASCGHEVISANDKIYKWTVYNQQEFEKSTREDVVFTFECSALDLVPEVSLTYAKTIEDAIVIPTQIGTPTLYFTSTPALTPETLVTSAQVLGTPLYLRLRFQPTGNVNPSSVDPDLSIWGIYCRNLYASPSSDNNYQNRRVDLLNSNGCPRTDQEFLRPTHGFRGTRPSPGDLYYSTTGALEVANFDLSETYPTGKTTTVYVVCEFELCWRPEDQMCIDRCAALSGNGLGKRDVQSYVAVANFTIVGTDDDGDSEMKKANSDSSILLPLLVSAAVVILLVIASVVFVCCRRRHIQDYKHQRDTPSVTSEVASLPPYYFSGDHSKLDKMSGMHPAFTSPRY